MPRPTDWQDTVTNFQPDSGAQASASLDGVLTPVDLRGATLIRTIVQMGAHSRTVAGAWGVQRLTMVIGIVSREAFTAGVFPDPVTSDDKPPRGGIWRSTLVVGQNGVGTPVVSSTGFIDLRAARKIENGRLFFIVDNTSLAGTAFDIGLAGIVRVLIKLS